MAAQTVLFRASERESERGGGCLEQQLFFFFFVHPLDNLCDGFCFPVNRKGYQTNEDLAAMHCYFFMLHCTPGETVCQKVVLFCLFESMYMARNTFVFTWLTRTGKTGSFTLWKKYCIIKIKGSNVFVGFFSLIHNAIIGLPAKLCFKKQNPLTEFLEDHLTLTFKVKCQSQLGQ